MNQIEEERVRLTSRITRKADLVDVLNEISAREETRYQKECRKQPPQHFTEQEMKELAAHAESRRDPQFYRTLIGLERGHDARAFRGLPILPVERVGRAKASEVMAEIALREAQTRLQRFADQRERVTVMVKDNGAQDIGLERMADVEPRTPLERLFRPLIERSEKYRRVANAIEIYGSYTAQQYEDASSNHTILKEEARAYEQEFIRQNLGMAVPRPQFTAWEIGKLELHALKETDPVLREHYDKLYRESLADSRYGSETRTANAIRKEFSRTIVVDEREAAHILEPVGIEGFTEPDRHIEDGSLSFAGHFERQQTMGFER